MAWRKETLGKASKSGFAYADREGKVERENTSSADNELILKFKQFKAQMQVCGHCFTIGRFVILSLCLGRDGRAGEAMLGTRFGCRTYES